MSAEVEENFEGFERYGGVSSPVGVEKVSKGLGMAGDLEGLRSGSVGGGGVTVAGLEAGPDEEAERQNTVGGLTEDGLNDGQIELGLGAGEDSFECWKRGVRAEEMREFGGGIGGGGDSGEEAREGEGREGDFEGVKEGGEERSIDGGEGHGSHQ